MKLKFEDFTEISLDKNRMEIILNVYKVLKLLACRVTN